MGLLSYNFLHRATVLYYENIELEIDLIKLSI